MALVAYSDESDLSGSEEEVVNHSVHVNHNNSHISLNKNRTINEETSQVSEGEQCQKSFSQSLDLKTKLLDKSNIIENTQEDTDVVDDVPTVATWNITKNIDKDGKSPLTSLVTPLVKSKKNLKSNKLMLVLPSLSEFCEEEDPDDILEKESSKKKLKPSGDGTGLFAVLPQPRGPTHLVPQRVARNKTTSSSQLNNQRKSIKKTSLHAANNSDDDEDSAQSSADFFSLNSSPASISPLPSLPNKAPNLIRSSTPIEVTEPLKARSKPQQINEPHFAAPSSFQQPPNNVTTQSFVTADDSESYIAFSTDPSPIDPEALRRLAGRRNKNEVSEIIDINADDALMSRDEWVTRALCDEKPKKSFSRKSEGNPTQQQKRKHQITYLAHQAQEREQELQNALGQNRFTRIQTQSKYGF